MTHEEAVALLRPAKIAPGGSWADLGAGAGRFTFALAELLGRDGTVRAVDKNPRILKPQRPPEAFAAVSVEQRDFTKPLGADAFGGVLLANSLHYVRDQRRLLGQLMLSVRPGGKLVIIEYDTRRGNPWIPFPVPFERLEALNQKAGLAQPRKVHSRASRFGRTMYVAVTDIPPGPRA